MTAIAIIGAMDLYILFAPFHIFQAEGYVFIHGHMGPQRIVLEQEAHASFIRRHIDPLFS